MGVRDLKYQAQEMDGETKTLNKQVVKVRAEAEEVEAQPATAELIDQIAVAKRECEEMEGKLSQLEGAGGEETRKRIERSKKKFATLRDEWAKRRRGVKEAVDCFADAMEKKPKDFCKQYDIETDEMAGVTLPPRA